MFHVHVAPFPERHQMNFHVPTPLRPRKAGWLTFGFSHHRGDRNLPDYTPSLVFAPVEGRKICTIVRVWLWSRCSASTSGRRTRISQMIERTPMTTVMKILALFGQRSSSVVDMWRYHSVPIVGKTQAPIPFGQIFLTRRPFQSQLHDPIRSISVIRFPPLGFARFISSRARGRRPLTVFPLFGVSSGIRSDFGICPLGRPQYNDRRGMHRRRHAVTCIRAIRIT
jgi:hypothetical protein